MMSKQLLLAFAVLTPVCAQAVDTAALRNKMNVVADELRSKVIPTVEKVANAIKNGDFSSVEQYLADPNKQLIPQAALQFGRDHISQVQEALQNVVDMNIPSQAVQELNNLQAGMGTQLMNLKSQAANALRSINLAEVFGQLADSARRVTVADAKSVAMYLKNKYQTAGINIQPLLVSAQNLGGTLKGLEIAASNLKNRGVLDTLNGLSEKVPAFIQGDADARAAMQLDLLSLVADLNEEQDAIKATVNNFAPFARELVSFVEQLFNTFGDAVWAQIPAAQQRLAKSALAQLQANKDQFMNAVNQAKAKLSSIVQ
jgi:hypothetical protein